MSKSNGVPGDSPKTPPAITSLSVAGFKSIVEEQTLEVRPLTLLAGANSSGKSSMMQPLLLLKQTLDSPYDPGPLLLNGPNARFTSAAQFLSVVPDREMSRRFSISIGISSGAWFKVEYEWNAKTKLIKAFANSYKVGDDIVRIVGRASKEQIARLLGNLIPTGGAGLLEGWGGGSGLVQRAGCLLSIQLSDHSITFDWGASEIKGVIHLSGLRGTPARTYPMTAIGTAFPGTFENYVASLIASWKSDSLGTIGELGDDLGLLGLTWKVEATRVNDTEVEVRVGRLPHPKQGGARDLVSIADVGFGVSQTLPVVVALRVAQPGQLVYIEQPEIHLHPRAQVAMARLLVNAANRGVRVVAETHSSLILLAVQTLVAEGIIAPELVGLNWFHRDQKSGTTRIKTAELDEAGRFGDWPEDFDEVALEAENRYLSAAEERLAKG
jgi:hypothetical protein